MTLVSLLTNRLYKFFPFWSSSIVHYRKLSTMKLTPDQMKSVLSPEIKELSDIFNRNGFEIRIAGGAIRDLLMGLVPTDFDFATPATPQEMTQMFHKENIRIVAKGGEIHGTVVAQIKDKNFDCTTLRIDQKTDGRHAQVEFTQDWKLDASRRDLTINALFLGLDGTVYDYFNGIQHLKEKCVLFVGDPDQRIHEDYLRILRYFRFFGRVATDVAKHDPAIIGAIQRNAEGLSKISGERLWQEIKKITIGRFGGDLLTKIMDCKVGPHIGFPLDFDCDNVRLVYNRLESAPFEGISVHPCTVLAAGFPKEEDAQVLIKRVKCSNREKEALLFPINNRNLFTESEPLKTIQAILVDLVYKCKRPKSQAITLALELAKYVGRVDLLEEINAEFIPNFPINGMMLQGRVKKNRIQLEMNRLLDIWKTSDYMLSSEELLENLNS